MAPHWARWMDGEKPTFFSFYVLKTTLENGILCNVEAETTSLAGPSREYSLDWDNVSVLLYSLKQHLDCVLEFHWDPTQDMEWTKYPWSQYYMVHFSMICFAQDLYNLGVFYLNL